MDIVLAAAHKLETSSLTSPLILDSSIPFAKDIISELIFHYSDIVHLEIHDTNLSFAEGKNKVILYVSSRLNYWNIFEGVLYLHSFPNFIFARSYLISQFLQFFHDFSTP